MASTVPERSFHEDSVVGKAFDRRLMRRLLRYTAPYRGAMAAAVVVILAVAGMGLVGPFLIRAAVDGPLDSMIRGAGAGGAPPADALSRLRFLAGIFLVVSVVLLVLRYAQGLLLSWLGQKVMLDLRREVFRHLLRMPVAFFDHNPVGRLVTRITSDVEALNELFSSGFVSFFADLLVLVAITLALIWVNLHLALVTLSVLPLLLLATFVFRAKASRYYREQRGHLSHLNAFTQESIQGVGVIQMFHREAQSLRDYVGINHSYMTTFLKSVLCYAVYFPVVEFFATGAQAGIIWEADRQIHSVPPALTLGDFFLFWYFVGRFFQPIRDMAERYNILQSAMAAAERVFKVLDTPETLRDPPRPRPIAKLRGQVELDHVWFAYSGDDHVLMDVSFRVEPGRMLAIVGATGAGKSTVIQLLGRFSDPQRGAIRIDGVDVREYRKADLRSRISVVMQDAFIFSRSVRENIRLATPSISDAAVEAAARTVNADRFISRLPNGYDSVLAERGRTLSAGERQLLAFARALAHDPDILVLDEATANVDSETEALIQDALPRLLSGRTSIVIAHRLSTVQKADTIVVLHKGRVREVGTHRDLLARGGVYRKLYELQYR